MTSEPSNTSMMTDREESFHPPLTEKPTIKILIYTDDPSIIKKGAGLFGLGRMRQHLQDHAPFFASVRITLVSRNSDRNHPADFKLDFVLAEETYDQIWFFGIHQVNKQEYTLGIPGGGGPQSELNPKEVSTLEDWMRIDKEKQSKGVGVLMTGDHANPHPEVEIPTGQDEFCPRGHETFLCLGRAVGKQVPRAGLLRKWEGPPTRCVEDNFNTQVLASGTDIEHTRLQIDNTPQQLILETFDAEGKPTPGGQPHPLFRDKRGQWIQVFPDHMHEGAVITEFDKKLWPTGARLQPKPHVVAYGTDKRNGKRLNIVAAYDGDSAGVGRIVADSTWHHYLNMNLTSFLPDAPEGSAADHIGQFYANLAVWLSPLAKRREMACLMFWWLAKHPLMLEEVGSGPLNIGRTAYQILTQVASYSEINELLQAACPETLREQFESLYLPDREPTLSHLPSKELVLGSVINEYHRVMARDQRAVDARCVTASSIIERGYSQAFGTKLVRVVVTAIKALNTLQFLPLITLSKQGREAARNLKSLGIDQLIIERRNTMSGCATKDPWTILMALDKEPDDPATLIFNLEIDPDTCRTTGDDDDRVTTCPISGTVEAEGMELSHVRGTCRSSDDFDVAVMNLDFRWGHVGIFMSGFVIGEATFLGRFRAYMPDTATPAGPKARQPELRLAPEPGDTGTGGGSMTILVSEQNTPEAKKRQGPPARASE